MFTAYQLVLIPLQSLSVLVQQGLLFVVNAHKTLTIGCLLSVQISDEAAAAEAMTRERDN